MSPPRSLAVMAIMFVVAAAGCIGGQGTQQSQSTADESGADSGWLDAVLKDVSSGEEYRISDFAGKPVLVESFAVWCPTCKRQQDEIGRLHEEVGDSVVSVSLDTDPEEEESLVVEHVNRHGYDWRYSVSPPDVTRQLIEEYGLSVINAPGTPVILVCPDQSSRLLDRGVKSADDLKTEIEAGC